MATDFYSNNRVSDNVYFVASKVLNAKTDGQYNLIRLPRYAFVSEVYLSITTAFSGGVPAISIGWAGNAGTADADGFMTNTVADPTFTGVKKATDGMFSGKYFNAGVGSITLTISGTPTAGVCQVFCNYAIIF